MTRFDLATMTRRIRNVRRSAIVIRDIAPPAVLSTNLYRACYAPIVAIWQRAIDPIVAEYERTLSAMTTDAPADVQAQIDGASNEFERIFLRLTAALQDFSLRTERWQRSKWSSAVLNATGVSLDTLLGPEDVRSPLSSWLTWNTELVRDVSNQTRKRISDAVFAGLQNRTPARDVAKQIREAVDMSKRRSVGIASDQLSKMTSALADERRRQAGLSVWKWRHSGKKHPRETHRARDGHHYSDDPALVGREVNGVTVQEPPAENDRPGRPPWCGCRSQSVLIFD